MTGANFAWPKRGDQAFKPYPAAGVRPRLEAFVLPSDGAYLVGFQRAGDMIVEGARASDRTPHNLFFPVAYLYRHHLELMLKELVRLGVRVGRFDRTEKSLTEHNLVKLWNNVKELIKEVWPDSPEDDINAVEAVIKEFHRLDKSGQAFRYARDLHGCPHLKEAPQTVDLGNLKGTVDAVSAFLDAAYAGIEQCDPGQP